MTDLVIGEVADRRAGEKADPAPATIRQARKIGRLMKSAVTGWISPAGIIRAQPVGGRFEKFPGNIERGIGAGRLKRVEQDPRLDCRAGPVLDQHGARTGLARNLRRIRRENRGLGARGIIFGQLRDVFEQLRSGLVIEPARGNHLRRRARPAQTSSRKAGSAVS